MSDSDYQVSKEDVAIMLQHLMKAAPEYATPENAIKLLEHDKAQIEKLEELYPEVIEQILQDNEQ